MMNCYDLDIYFMIVRYAEYYNCAMQVKTFKTEFIIEVLRHYKTTVYASVHWHRLTYDEDQNYF